jgi:hypothetical protein
MDEALPDKHIYLQSMCHMVILHVQQQNKTLYRCYFIGEKEE